jgi:hypothetical protein
LTGSGLVKAGFSINCLLVAIFFTIAGSNLSAAIPASRDYPVRPVPFTVVQLDDVFRAPRLETNRAVIIPHAFGQCQASGRMDNFDRAAKAWCRGNLENRVNAP